MSDFIDDSLLKDYFDEAFSQVDNIEENILILEKDPSDKDAINTLFRAAHTLKGGSATVQMEEITSVTHALEDLMDEIREDKIVITGDIIDTLLDALDVIKKMLDSRNNGQIYSDDYSGVLGKIKNFIDGGADTVDTSKEDDDKSEEVKTENETGNLGSTILFEDYDTDEKDSKPVEGDKFALTEYDILELNDANTENFPIYKIVVGLDEANPMKTVGGIQIFTSLREVGTVLKTVPDFDEIYSEVFHKDIMYIVASNLSEDVLRGYVDIPDTTDSIEITLVDSNVKKDKPADKKEKQSEPAVESKASESKEKVVEKDEAVPETPKKEDVKAIISNDVVVEKTPNKKPIQKSAQKVAATSMLRVDSSRIDTLLNLVSEIVINKATFNQVGSQFSENFDYFMLEMNSYKDRLKNLFESMPRLFDHNKSDDYYKDIKTEKQNEFNELYTQFDSFISKYKTILARYKVTIQNLDRISASLQEGVMRVRMVPMKQIFSRFPRLVRDLSRDLKKDIELILTGEDTEVDKAMIDDLIDPLIHIVRNSIDHGLESPDDRIEMGKSNPGRLELSAKSEGNIISINISDDGKGIDKDAIHKKAIEKNLVSADTSMKEQDIFNILFEPGFSTANKVTAVSGRGVGLDVVKKNIEKLNGTIRISSTPGVGSTFSIKIPLTLAIIQGLLVEVNKEIYAIPISSVIESIRIKPEEIKMIDNYEVINVRDDVLSLLRLNRLFHLGDDSGAKNLFVVIVGNVGRKIGVLVDSVIGEEDIVIKPLRDKYTNTPGIAGATILGDGTVSLILDVSQLIELGLTIDAEIESRKDGLKGV